MWWRRSEKAKPPQDRSPPPPPPTLPPPESLNDQLGKRLLEAAKQGDVKEADSLLLSNADIHHKDPTTTEVRIEGTTETWRVDGCTALHWAAIHNRVEMIFLIQRGADIHRQDDTGEWTALHWASALGKAESVSILLHYKAHIECRSTSEYTPLHYASLWGHAELVAILLHHKADIHSQTKSGDTPLHIASEYGKSSVVVGLLLASKADPTIKDTFGRTAESSSKSSTFADFKNDPKPFEAQREEIMTKAMEGKAKAIQRMEDFLAQMRATELRELQEKQALLDKIAEEERSAIEKAQVAQLQAEKAKLEADEGRRIAEQETAALRQELKAVNLRLETVEMNRGEVERELNMTRAQRDEALPFREVNTRVVSY